MSKTKLRVLFLIFFFALALPSGILVWKAYQQLQWEALHQQRSLAEEITDRVNHKLLQLIQNEEARAFTDYSFLNVAGEASSNFLQRSPLSEYPVDTSFPGLMGYFQIEPSGAYSTPLLPQEINQTSLYGISQEEYFSRSHLEQEIYQILSQNRLVSENRRLGEKAKRNSPTYDSLKTAESEAGRVSSDLEESENEQPDEGVDRIMEISTSSSSSMPKRVTFSDEERQLSAKQQKGDAFSAQEAFDNLDKKKVLDKKKTSYQARRSEKKAPLVLESPPDLSFELRNRSLRKEQNQLPAKQSLFDVMKDKDAVQQSQIKVDLFESEIDPFDFSLLDSGHFVLYRKVWREGKRYIQGAIIQQSDFLVEIIGSTYTTSSLAQLSRLSVFYDGEPLQSFMRSPYREPLNARKISRELPLYENRLLTPFNQFDLEFTITHLPIGPGGSFFIWLALILATIICVGTYLLYRLGLRQLDISQQQRNFVSAVSHELKTPLTSIRMYSEMLTQDWVGEEKRKEYYDFIFNESERLSRLINNVLQLARMSRNEFPVDLKSIKLGELVDITLSKIASQIDNAGFKLNLNVRDACREKSLMLDHDGFIQVIINLIDNALKFSAQAENKTIDLSCRLVSSHQVAFSVRDYGPGIPKKQMKKIFTLFYRSENELTRKTVGTGIGLALVHQLVIAMKGKIDLLNREPGVEFKLLFPYQ